MSCLADVLRVERVKLQQNLVEDDSVLAFAYNAEGSVCQAIAETLRKNLSLPNEKVDVGIHGQIEKVVFGIFRVNAKFSYGNAFLSSKTLQHVVDYEKHNKSVQASLKKNWPFHESCVLKITCDDLSNATNQLEFNDAIGKHIDVISNKIQEHYQPECGFDAAALVTFVREHVASGTLLNWHNKRVPTVAEVMKRTDINVHAAVKMVKRMKFSVQQPKHINDDVERLISEELDKLEEMIADLENRMRTDYWNLQLYFASQAEISWNGVKRVDRYPNRGYHSVGLASIGSSWNYWLNMMSLGGNEVVMSNAGYLVVKKRINKELMGLGSVKKLKVPADIEWDQYYPPPLNPYDPCNCESTRPFALCECKHKFRKEPAVDAFLRTLDAAGGWVEYQPHAKLQDTENVYNGLLNCMFGWSFQTQVSLTANLAILVGCFNYEKTLNPICYSFRKFIHEARDEDNFWGIVKAVVPESNVSAWETLLTPLVKEYNDSPETHVQRNSIRKWAMYFVMSDLFRTRSSEFAKMSANNEGQVCMFWEFKDDYNRCVRRMGLRMPWFFPSDKMKFLLHVPMRLLLGTMFRDSHVLKFDIEGNVLNHGLSEEFQECWNQICRVFYIPVLRLHDDFVGEFKLAQRRK